MTDVTLCTQELTLSAGVPLELLKPLRALRYLCLTYPRSEEAEDVLRGLWALHAGPSEPLQLQAEKPLGSRRSHTDGFPCWLLKHWSAWPEECKDVSCAAPEGARLRRVWFGSIRPGRGPTDWDD